MVRLQPFMLNFPTCSTLPPNTTIEWNDAHGEDEETQRHGLSSSQSINGPQCNQQSCITNFKNEECFSPVHAKKSIALINIVNESLFYCKLDISFKNWNLNTAL